MARGQSSSQQKLPCKVVEEPVTVGIFESLEMTAFAYCEVRNPEVSAPNGSLLVHTLRLNLEARWFW